MYETPLTGLVLSGGGARAAYQVGVLRAISQLRRQALGPRSRLQNPFGIICGTSAGAINAAALACHAERFEAAVEVIAKVWQNFSADQVYRADSLGVIRSGARWLTMMSIGWLIARWRRARPRSLLDNEPLAQLLQRMVPLDRLPMMLAERQLHALAITASSYTSGDHFTFYSADHPGASGWFGDGSMRNTAPLSPAIHLGAQRLLIIGAGRLQEPGKRQVADVGYPSLAQIGGHAMASIFLDALQVDIERMKRINRTLALLPDSALSDTTLRPMEALVISPSQRIDDIAARHLGSLPVTVRALLRGVGVSGEGASARGSALASYLLFEAPFTGELIKLGEADTLARRDEVMSFFGWDRPPRRAAAAADLDISLP